MASADAANTDRLDEKIKELKALLNRAARPERRWNPPFQATRKVRGLYAADVDGDGQVEVVVGTDENKVYLLNAADGTVRWSFRTGEYKAWVPTVYAAPVRGNRALEVVAGSDNGRIYVLDADGRLLWERGRPDRMRSVYAADVDQDGAIEVLAASFDGHLDIYGPNGELRRHYHHDDNIFKLRTADVDGDGEIEIVAATASGRILIYTHQQHARAAELACKMRVFALELADLDRDGHIEILAGSFDRNLYVWDGYTLEQKWVADLGARIYAVLVTDIDGDDADEILVATTNGDITVFDNRGRRKWRFFLDHWAFDIWVGDIDHDGAFELLTCSEDENYAQLYQLPDIKALGAQIRQVHAQIGLPPSPSWDLSLEQWQLLSLIFPGLSIPEPVTNVGVCDRAVRSRDLFKEALRRGLELRASRLDFVWERDVDAEIRDLAIYRYPDPTGLLIWCAPDYRSCFAVDGKGQERFRQSDIATPCRRIEVAPFFDPSPAIILGLHKHVLTVQGVPEYKDGLGNPVPTSDWVEDMDVADVDEDGHPEILLASYDGRAYVWDSNLAEEWKYPDRKGGPTIHAVCGLDIRWGTTARMVIGSADGSVLALNPALENKVVWRYQCQRRVFALRTADFRRREGDPPLYLIVVGSDDGSVHVLDTDGVLRWKYYVGDPVKWIEIFDIDQDHEKEILVGASDGSFLILDSEGDLELENQLGDRIQGLQVADIDDDGNLEMVFGLRNRAKLFAYRYLSVESADEIVAQALSAWQGQSDYAHVLNALCTDPDSRLRAYGVQLRVKDAATQLTLDDLRPFVRDRSEEVRVALAETLPRLTEVNPNLARQLFRELVGDSSWKVQRQLAKIVADFYRISREAGEDCVRMLRGANHFRVRRELVRSLVRMILKASPKDRLWAYVNLQTIAEYETDEWVSHEIARGLASFLSQYPEQAAGLLDVEAYTATQAVSELLDKQSMAYLTLVANMPQLTQEAARFQRTADKWTRDSLSVPEDRVLSHLYRQERPDQRTREAIADLGIEPGELERALAALLEKRLVWVQEGRWYNLTSAGYTLVSQGYANVIIIQGDVGPGAAIGGVVVASNIAGGNIDVESQGEG